MLHHPPDRHAEFLRAFTAHEPAVRAFARRLVPRRADADDVMQEVAVVLWEKFSEFRQGGDFKAWARRDGSWGADGSVQHRGLLCGTYTLSLRVGRGQPGCVDVRWFGEPRAVADVKLCNDAAGLLAGGNSEFRDVARFDEITCAERTISCGGNCK